MNPRHTLLRRTLLTAVCASSLISMIANASEAWPNRPIKIVVPYPAGGGTDALARLVAERLREQVGQSVIVENRAGGGGNLGTEVVARSAPDGYTLLMGDNSMSIYSYLYPKLTYNPIDDFVPTGAVAVAPIVLVSNVMQPFKSLADLMGAMKATPGKFDYAFGGLGTPQHLVGQLFNARSGVEFNGVPYRGSGPALQDVLAGQVGYGFFAIGSVLPYIRSGKLRGYGIALDQRAQIAPEIPTFAEQGVKGVDGAVRYFLAAPAKTPKEIVNRLSSAVDKLRSDKEIIATFEKQGVEIGTGTPEEVTRMLRREGPVWGQLIRDKNIKPE